MKQHKKQKHQELSLFFKSHRKTIHEKFEEFIFKTYLIGTESKDKESWVANSISSQAGKGSLTVSQEKQLR